MMRARLSLIAFVSLFLSACGGGSSGSNGPDPFNSDGNSDPVIAITLAILDADCNAVEEPVFTSDTQICVRATVTSDGEVAVDQVVEYALSNNIGTLSANSSLTNSQGISEVLISNVNGSLGADTVTATYSSGSASANYEYISGVVTTPEIAASISFGGEAVSRFRVGETVNLEAILQDDGVGISNIIVNFSATGTGISITPADALTDENGRAVSSMSASDTAVGAHVLTASTTINDVAFTSNVNFEVLPQEVTSESLLTLAIRDENCADVASPSFTTNETICIQAVLTNDGIPVSAKIISFNLNNALGALSASTALTNANGLAQVFLTNPSANVGADTVTASINNLSESANYEFLAVPPEVSTIPEVTISMLLNGDQVSRFRADEQVQVQALVLDAADQPVADEIVTFTVQGTGPLLTPSTALTNSQGIAQVNMTADNNSLGAFAVQADVVLDTFTFSDSLNFEVQASGTIIDESATRFGHFNSDGVFVEGIVGSSAEVDGEVVISAGATVGFNVALVNENDERILTPTPVTFTTNCVENGQATIDQSVTTINGEAFATFEDINCAGSSGNIDQVIASVVINNNTLTINRQITIQPENIGSVSFVSAMPDEIVLAGTGGQNSASVSTLTFQVNGELGNPLAQQEVSFALNTSTGGLSIDPVTGLTNSTGQVSTRVTAGNVPTAVRVTASVMTEEGQEIRTQSDLLSVNTGLPDQNSFSMSTTNFNPEADSIDGQTAQITVRLADSFNNPVPNGTTVNFTTEGGVIQPSCTTGEDANGVIDPAAANTGTCSVTWTSANPRVADHRITILATAIGHETLFDINGNNAYDDADGGPITDGTDDGFGVSQFGQNGFVDHSEAWRDDNENGTRDPAEIFIDYNSDEAFNGPDGLFNGPQCTSSTLCGQGEGATLHVRKALVMVMSGSSALWRIYAGDISNINNVVFSNDSSVAAPQAYAIPEDTSATLTLVYYDDAGQVLPSGTQLGTLDVNGNISNVVDTINNTNSAEISGIPGSVEVLSTLSNVTGDGDFTSSFSFAIDTPSGIRTNVDFTVTRN